MNLFKLFKTNRISLGFINHSFNEVKLEMEERIRPTLTGKWKVKQFTLTDIHKLTSIYSISDLLATKVVIWQPVSINFDLVAFITNTSYGWPGLLRGYSEEYNRKTIRFVFLTLV